MSWPLCHPFQHHRHFGSLQSSILTPSLRRNIRLPREEFLCSTRPKILLYLGQRSPPRLWHAEPADHRCYRGAAGEKEVGAAACFREEYRRDQSNKEICQPVGTVGDASGSSSGSLGLDFGSVNLQNDAP